MSFTILLVDDDQDFREEFSDAFCDDYKVIQSASGHEAVNCLEKPNEIDLLILDVNLPDGRGTLRLQQLKTKFPHLPIVIFTGFSSKDVAIEALKGRADDYLEKPLSISHAKSVIDRLLDKHLNPVDIQDEDSRGKVERIKRFADRNVDKKITLNDAAQTVGLSPKYLSRIFKEQTGMDFSDYRLEGKIAKSKELLEHSGRTISQISEELGYQNLETFIRLFKRSTRMTPAVYRARVRAKKKKAATANFKKRHPAIR